MPTRDGTGPMGQGAMTGRGLGNCAGVNTGLYGTRMGRRIGRGMGCGLGLRRGFGGFYANQAPVMSDQEELIAEKELLQRRLDIVNQQLDEDLKSAK